MVKIYADGANLDEMKSLAPKVDGFTTNPSLMRKAGVTDYLAFCRAAAALGKPISFEVFADEFAEMKRQARLLAALGSNVYVKIPITNTRGESSAGLITQLSAQGIKVNVTAVFTMNQVQTVEGALTSTPAIISIFSGRIADTGIDPKVACRFARKICRPETEVLWASTRELINIKQAEACGCDIITVPNDILRKMPLFAKDLAEYSLETVRMFHDDAKASGFTL